MKRTILLILILSLCISFCACGQSFSLPFRKPVPSGTPAEAAAPVEIPVTEEASPAPAAAEPPIFVASSEESPAAPAAQDADYTGLWVNDQTANHSINVYEQNGDFISIGVTARKMTADGTNISAIDVTSINDILILDGRGSKEYTDSWNSRGIIHLSFSGDSLTVDYEIIERDPMARWGIDYGAGTYHRAAEEDGVEHTVIIPGLSVMTDNPFYAIVESVGNSNEFGTPITVRIREQYTFLNSEVKTVNQGDELFGKDRSFRVTDVSERDSGQCWLEGSYRLIRSKTDGLWRVFSPSEARVFRELGTAELLVSADVEIVFDEAVRAFYVSEIPAGGLPELFAGYDVFYHLPCLITMKNGTVSKMSFEYTP